MAGETGKGVQSDLLMCGETGSGQLDSWPSLLSDGKEGIKNSYFFSPSWLSEVMRPLQLASFDKSFKKGNVFKTLLSSLFLKMLYFFSP